MCIESVNYKGNEYKIKYIHERQTRPATLEEFDRLGVREIVLPNGGLTTAFIGDIEAPIAMGVAPCSKKDIYSKPLGRMIATGRLLKKLGLNTKLAL